MWTDRHKIHGHVWTDRHKIPGHMWTDRHKNPGHLGHRDTENADKNVNSTKERRRKKKVGYIIASNERRLKIVCNFNKIKPKFFYVPFSNCVRALSLREDDSKLPAEHHLEVYGNHKR